MAAPGQKLKNAATLLAGKKRLVAFVVGLMSASIAFMFSSSLPRSVSIALLFLTVIAITLGGSKESRKKPNLWGAVVIFAICLPLSSVNTDVRQITGSIGKFWPVMALLAGVALFRHSLLRSGLAALIAGQLVKAKEERKNTIRVALATTVMAPVGGQGTISIVCTALCKQVVDRLALSRISMRALCSSMYVLPTTVVSAAVATAIPQLDAGRVLLFGMPLMLAAVAGSMVPRLEAAATPEDRPAVKKVQPLLLLAFILLVGIVVLDVTGQMILAFASAVVSGYLFEVLVFSKNGLVHTKNEVARSIDTITAELLLLAASGLLILTVDHLNLLDFLPAPISHMITDQHGILILLIVVLPIITVIGIHSMILFGVFFPLIHPPMFDATHIQYLAWVSMFVMANLLSPVATGSMLAAISLQVSSHETSYRSNWRFCLAMMFATYFYLLCLVSSSDGARERHTTKLSIGQAQAGVSSRS